MTGTTVRPATRPLVSRRAARIPLSPTAELDATMKAMVADGHDVINLGAGETDFPTPAYAADGGHAAIREGFTRYTPVAGIPALREAIAAWLNGRYGTRYDACDVVVSNGAKHALFNALTVLLDPGDEVLVPAPYWVSYPPMVELAGGVPVIVQPGSGFKLRADTLRAHTTPRTRVLILNNPNNPTGVVYTGAELRDLCDTAAALGLTVLSDEIYDQQVYPPAEFHAAATLTDRVVTVGGVSKTFAMTGWRIGYLAGPAELARAATAVQGHTASAPSSVSQRAALAALADPQRDPQLRRQRDELDHRRRLLIDAIRRMPGLSVPAEPAGAFYLFVDVTGLYERSAGTGGLRSASDIAAALLGEQRVGAVPGEQFGAPGHLRLSYVVGHDRLADAIGRLESFCATHRP